MGKILYKCQFGVIHSTARCRCISDHVENRQVKCDVPDQHTKSVETIHERMAKTVDAFLGGMVMPIVKDTLVDMLEEDVKDWLIEHHNQ